MSSNKNAWLIHVFVIGHMYFLLLHPTSDGVWAQGQARGAA